MSLWTQRHNMEKRDKDQVSSINLLSELTCYGDIFNVCTFKYIVLLFNSQSKQHLTLLASLLRHK